MPYIDETNRDIIVAGFFQRPPDGLAKFATVCTGDLDEYAALVVRQLRSRKVELRAHVRGGGAVFAVGKRDSAKLRLREVWHGARVSDCALPPPAPPCLAGPTALLDLESSIERPLFMSKRDGRCLFDQLSAPWHLRGFFGRPAVKLQAIIDQGMTLDEIKEHVVGGQPVTSTSWLYPCSRVWPMGFSWSSFIAQSTMLAVCKSAGLTQERALTADRPAPIDLDNTFALATDDILHFSRISQEHSVSVMKAVERSFEKHSLERHPDKDITGQLNCTGIGVDLCDGTHLAPNALKLLMLLSALGGLCGDKSVREVHPWGMAALDGVVQWFNLLSRPLFAVLFEVYNFARRDHPKTSQQLPPAVLWELHDVMALSPFWEADLTREWSTEVLATDAAPQFGLGVCSARVASSTARSIARKCSRQSSMAIVTPDDPSTEVKERVFAPVHIGLSQRRVRTVLSSKCKYQAHSGALECTAVVLGLQWYLRKAKNHCRRLPFLVDAQAVLGALVKGRSSAPTLFREVRRAAALAIAGDLHVKYIYVPSEVNPADAPSRGVRRTICKRKENIHQKAQSAASKTARMEAKFSKEVRKFTYR